MKILVIRLSSLGDVILTSPLMKQLRQLYPYSRIDYCTKAEYTDVIRFNPYVDNVIEADNELNFSNLRSLKKRLKKERYDLIIDAHNKLNTLYLRAFIGSRKHKLKKYSFRKFLLVRFKINLMKNLPTISTRYLNMIGKNAASDLLPEIYPDSESEKKAEKLISEQDLNGKDLVCIVPSSKHFTKTYPAELYTELISGIDTGKFTVILAGKGADENNIREIEAQLTDKVHNLCGKLSVLELFALIKKCKLVIGGDTGPMHIAEAAGVPIVMLAGSSVKEFGFYPQTKNAIVLENNNLSCRPCSHIGRSSCPKGHFKCMREIYPVEIKNAVESLLLVN